MTESENNIHAVKNDLLDAVQKLDTDKKRQTPFTDDRPGETWYHSFLKLEHPGDVAAGTELRQCHLLYAPAVIDAAGVVQVPASTLPQWNSPPDLTDNLLRRAIGLSMGQTIAEVRRIAVAEVRRIGFFGLVIAVGRMGQIPAGKLARVLTSQNGPGNNTINTAAIIEIWKVLSAL